MGTGLVKVQRRQELLRTGYPLLVRGLANLCVMVADTPNGMTVRFVTLEQGSYGVDADRPDRAVVQRTIVSA